MFIVLNCNELAGISDFGEKSDQVVPATRWQLLAGAPSAPCRHSARSNAW